MCVTLTPMWPFRKKQEGSRLKKSMERLVVGLIIGGAIGSIVGKKLVELHDHEHHKDKDKEEEDGNEG